MSANQITLFFILILLVGALSGSTFYYYNKSQKAVSPSQQSSYKQDGFSANLPTKTPNEQNQKVDELTQPAQPKSRMSYPSNTYTVGKGETLFSIGNKLLTPWTVLKRANNLVNENTVQSGMVLAIPKLDSQTDNYRINFTVNEESVSQKNKELTEGSESYLYNPIEVAKKDGQFFWGVDTQYEFKLIEANLSLGTALVEAKKGEAVIYIGLIQPKQKGERGLWVVYYSEEKR